MTPQTRRFQYFATRRAGCAQAILTGRLQTDSEALSWEYLGEQAHASEHLATICGGILREGGYMAVRAFERKGNTLGRLAITKVHPAA